MSIFGRLATNVFPLFYEEARVARYFVLPRSIGGVKAPGSGPEIVGSQWAPHFNLPGVVIDSPAVLFFTAVPHGSTHQTDTRISVRLFSSQDHLLHYTFIDEAPRSWHLVIRPRLLQLENNELIFNVYDGASATFSDAAILYTSNELTVKRRLVGVVAPD